MEDFIDIVLPIAMFVFSIAMAIVGAKKKKKETKPMEEEMPFFFSDDDTDVEEEEVPTAPVMMAPAQETLASPVPEIPEMPKKEEKKFSPEEKKKLIVYSEILKPKFDA